MRLLSEAFNALLKTIEEPPEWGAVFILCARRNRMEIPANDRVALPAS